MCLIQLSVSTPHFCSFFSKQYQELPLVALLFQEKISFKNCGVSTAIWGKPNNLTPNTQL
jgi:hypothetical protein